MTEPVAMLLFCPRCDRQHVDAADVPEHCSHECQGCGYTWRPADVPTTGVRTLETCGAQRSASVRLCARRKAARVTEADIQRDIMLEATRLGHRLFRNNRGIAAYKRDDGDVYRLPFGIGGDGGADLIGWTCVPIGLTVAVHIMLAAHAPTCVDCARELDLLRAGVKMKIFTAVETKSLTGRTAKKRLEDQKRFIAACKADGGIAGFCKSVEEYRRLVGAE